MKLSYFMDYSTDVHGLRFRLFGQCPKCKQVVNMTILMSDAFIYDRKDFNQDFEQTIRRAMRNHACDLSTEDLYIAPYLLSQHIEKCKEEGPFAGSLGPVIDEVKWYT